MRVLKVPLTDNVELLNKMKLWCLDNCSRDEFYFFPQKLAIGEPALFWFGEEEDALAFKFRYKNSQELVNEFRYNN